MIRSMLTAACLLTGIAHAAPGLLQHGGQFATGGVTTGRDMPNVGGNAALLPLTLKEGQRFRMSVFELPSIGVEFGPVDNFIDDIERLEDELDRVEFGQQSGQAVADEFNPILEELGDRAYVTVDAYMPVPLVPITFKAFGGVASVHLDYALSARASLLDSPLIVNQAENDLTTDSAMLVRAGQFLRGSIGYGRTLLTGSVLGFNGNLNIGGRLHVMQGKMSQAIAGIDDDSDDGAFDRIEDEFDALTENSTAVGLDVGAAFVSDHLHLGFNLKNLIPPSFDMPDVREGCERLNGADYCARVDNLGGLLSEVDRLGNYKMDPQATVEAVFTVPSTQLRLVSSLDLNSIENVGGDDYQNLYLGMIYEGPWYFPSVRLGYQSNLSGNKVDALTAGFTLFGVLNIDALYGLDDVIFDEDKVPRAAAVRVGFAVPFR